MTGKRFFDKQNLHALWEKFKTWLNNKLGDYMTIASFNQKVKTNVPENAVFTDTTYTAGEGILLGDDKAITMDINYVNNNASFIKPADLTEITTAEIDAMFS